MNPTDKTDKQFEHAFENRVEGATQRSRSAKWGDHGDEYEKNVHTRKRAKLRKKGRTPKLKP